MIWSLDEDVSPFTQWHCGSCGYHALEDEAKEADCSRCGVQLSMLLLKDKESTRRWCSACGMFESSKEAFAQCDA
jgi:hypothetical protein